MKDEPLVSSKLQEEIYDSLMHEEDVEPIKTSRLAALIEEIVGIGGKRILELGCGEGSLLEPFCANNECHGVDISSKQLKRAEVKGYRIYKQDLEMERLQFMDEYFDMLVFNEVIEHIVNTEHFLNEINRVLRKQGTLLISFPNVNQPISWLITVFRDLPPMYCARAYSPHMRDFTLKFMKALLKIKGFDALRIEGTYVYPFKNKLSQFFARRIPRLGEKIIIVAEKKREPALLPSVIWDIRNL